MCNVAFREEFESSVVDGSRLAIPIANVGYYRPVEPVRDGRMHVKPRWRKYEELCEVASSPLGGIHHDNCAGAI
jgi:hypothetical protein